MRGPKMVARTTRTAIAPAHFHRVACIASTQVSIFSTERSIRAMRASPSSKRVSCWPTWTANSVWCLQTSPFGIAFPQSLLPGTMQVVNDDPWDEPARTAGMRRRQVAVEFDVAHEPALGVALRERDDRAVI